MLHYTGFISMNAPYECVQTPAALEDLARCLQQETVIGLDTETTGLDVQGADYMVGFSLTCPMANRHFYIPLRHHTEETQLSLSHVMTVLTPFLESKDLLKILHHCKFDAHVFRREGVHLQGIGLDTLLAMHILNENEPSYGLKALATKFGPAFGFHETAQSYEAKFGSTTSFSTVPLAVAANYACLDTHLTYNLAQFILYHLDQHPRLYQVYYSIEHPLLAVVIAMEDAGLPIDPTATADLRQSLETARHEAKIVTDAAFPGVNVFSDLQLKRLIYDTLALTPVGPQNVKRETLERLVPQCEALSSLITYKKLQSELKVLETWEKFTHEDHRLRGQFNQMGAGTGRFSSSKPNLQNVAPLHRQVFRAPEGYQIVSIDYSQIEPRVAACLSRDPHLISVYNEGRDLYQEMAARFFNQPIEQCGDGSTYRKQAKTMFLSRIYGKGVTSLARDLSISKSAAFSLHRALTANYPALEQWIASVIDRVDQLGYTETLFGRKRRFPDHVSRVQDPAYDPHQYNEEIAKVHRQAPNSVVQGSAADLLKLALIGLSRALQAKGEDWRLIATIHDEVLLEIPNTASLDDLNDLVRAMTQFVNLSVPLTVDVAMGPAWSELSPIHL